MDKGVCYIVAPQGPSLSPILSTLYTSSLLETIKMWTHSNLSLYVNDVPYLQYQPPQLPQNTPAPTMMTFSNGLLTMVYKLTLPNWN
jgi:hypothetical protein